MLNFFFLPSLCRKPDFSIPYSTLSGNGGWDTQGHSSAVDPAWTSGSYVHSGRGFTDDLTPTVFGASTDKSSTSVPKMMEKRNDRQPTIVMAQSKHTAVTPYNYLNKQNRRKWLSSNGDEVTRRRNEIEKCKERVTLIDWTNKPRNRQYFEQRLLHKIHFSVCRN